MRKGEIERGGGREEASVKRRTAEQPQTLLTQKLCQAHVTMRLFEFTLRAKSDPERGRERGDLTFWTTSKGRSAGGARGRPIPIEGSDSQISINFPGVSE